MDLQSLCVRESTQGFFLMQITFDPEETIGKIDELTKVQLPRASYLALSKSLFQTREDFKQRSQSIFTKTVPFTRNAVLYDRPKQVGNELQARIYLRDSATKGNAPADYLKPQITGGPVFPTRFQRRLRARGFLGGSQGNYMRPVGSISKGEYTRALWGISAMEDLRLSGKYGKSNYRTAGSYVFVPLNLHQLATSGISPELKQRAAMVRGLNKGRIPSAGIYKVNKTSLSQRFVMLNEIPKVKRKFDFQAYAEDTIESIFSKELAKNILR